MGLVHKMGTDLEEFSDDEGGFYGGDAAGGDEDDVCMVRGTLELGDELAGHGI